MQLTENMKSYIQDLKSLSEISNILTKKIIVSKKYIKMHKVKMLICPMLKRLSPH